MLATNEVVQKLWNLCHVLRDDGISYLQYINELTYLLFLKMMQETEQEAQLPEGFRWNDLVSRDGMEQLTFYRAAILHLGSEATTQRVQAIFANAQTALKQPRILKKLVQSIDELDWYLAKEEALGDLYEGLLEKSASDKKSGGGQYFTPRPLTDCVVMVMQPQPGELVQDPASGTGGFLIAADRYIKRHTDELFDLSESAQSFQRHQAFYGVELVQDAHQLSLMNMLLHGIEGSVTLGDTLSSDGQRLAKADVILTNPPFGLKRGDGLPSRDDFTYPTSNKQLAFLQHTYRSLKPGGRAAVVLPDNVLFEDGQGRLIRTDLMDKCNLHTILRLPMGIFYTQGVRTNVLFFQRGMTEKGNTQQVWIYDMRANMPAFSKRAPLTRKHLQDFEQCYGNDPNGNSPRVDQGEDGRFRCFSREEIAKRGDKLYIFWLEEAIPLTLTKDLTQNQYYEELFAESVLPLRMMLIPSGSFLMGSPEAELERGNSEGPQHEVTLSQFFMGKYPVTQAQWYFVAKLPQVSRALELDPSNFKGDKRPVECVSWYDAVEFCDRLSVHTGRAYRLPTEAEWEYACRAGTTTPFHFGETITTDLANYRGTKDKEREWSGSYGRGSKGEYREETLPIDQFEGANAFGLRDLHGNVWEWCQDHLRNDYEGAPTDGSAWLTVEEGASRVLRGGSWLNTPSLCRSAFRTDLYPDNRINDIGFRVCCSGPRTL